MAERVLPWNSADDFALQQSAYTELVAEALREFLSKTDPHSVSTIGRTPQYRVKDANGLVPAFEWFTAPILTTTADVATGFQ